MTNKEAKEKLYIEWQKFLENNIDYDGTSDAYNMAFKALEQIDVLEKIRAEIENDWQLKKYPSSPFSCGLRRAIEIIDKYRNEVNHETDN